MKLILVPIVILCSLGHAFAQVFVGDVDINKDEKIRIVEVLVTERLTRKSINVFVDYGHKTNFKVGNIETDEKAQLITDPTTKKEIPFASSAALLNFMESRDWEHYDTVTLRDNGSADFYYYFRKKR